jgi:hypothetical protein
MAQRRQSLADAAWSMDLVPFARKYYGLGRNAAYAAAAAGAIPVIRVGNKWRGLPRVAERQLGGDS